MRFTKRRTEYLVRRWTAKHAVAAEVGLPVDTVSLARIEVRNAATGAPEVWVDGRLAGLGVSLTDRAGWAVCLVSGEPQAVGCDLELVEPRSPAFVRDFLTEAEQRLVQAAGSDVDRQVVANLIWSAKESALKVLRTGLRRDTRSVEVRLPAAAPGPGAWSTLAVRTVQGREFPGWWCRHGAFLLTVAYEAAAPAPVSIEDPPALTTAEPVHSWPRRPV
jgi:4'-phosphopantetheinyl transferase